MVGNLLSSISLGSSGQWFVVSGPFSPVLQSSSFLTLLAQLSP